MILPPTDQRWDMVCRVNSDPMAQPRARAVARVINGVPIANVYGAPKRHPIHGFKQAVLRSARAAHGSPMLCEPLRVDIVAIFKRPKSIKRPAGRLMKTTKPDADNVIKAILDALNGVWWQDDKFICQLNYSAWISALNEEPHLIVRVERLDKQQAIFE